MPAPPPPPPMAPAAPPPPVFSSTKNSPDDRGALLKSIRQGAKLKKTVTNDKSAPMIAGKVGNTTGNNNGATSNGGSSNFSGTLPSNGLGGLFAGGIPKLKPTGKLSTTNFSNKPLNNNDDVTSPNATPSKNFSSIQLELKKQLASDNRNRGPPPPAPNRTMSGGDSSRQPFSAKENVPNGLHLSQLSLNANSSTLHSNSSTLHRKTKSNANLSIVDSTDDVNNGFVPTRPVISHGKPNLAPKPPTLNGKPAAPQKKNGKPISRAHSMRSPRSPSPQTPDSSSANKFGTVRHMSSIISQSLSGSGHSQRLRTPLNSRPSAPPPSVPAQHPINLWSPVQSQAPPPPPPSKTNSVKHPNHAPPPPPAPTHAPPPPPPHKTQPVRQPPSVPVNNNTNPPPPPPPRNSSMRDTPTTKRVIIDLDEKFKSHFQTPEKFPQPPPYKNMLKIYSYKQGMHFKPGV